MTMPGVPGRSPGTPRVLTPHHQEGQFRLRRTAAEGCRANVAQDPVAVSVKAKRKKRWVTVATADQCDGWRSSRTGNHVCLKPLSYSPDTLLFVPHTPRRDGREDFNYKISRAVVSNKGKVTLGRTLRRGVLRVETSHDPAERVYAMKPNGEINDRYWNYCVNEGKQTWMNHGNAYCVQPSWTGRTVRLIR
jgi:hypothetical protein